MDTFFMLWIFDHRYFFGVAPCGCEHSLLIPSLVNLGLLGYMIADLLIYGDPNNILVGSCILDTLLIITIAQMYMKLLFKKLSNYEYIKLQNRSNNAKFFREFQCKKMVWSLNGLIIFCASLALFIYEAYMIRRSTYNSILIQFYINVAFWSYLGFIFLAFWIRKLWYLSSTWKSPKTYLQKRGVYA